MTYLVVSRKAGLFHVAKWLAAEAGENEVKCITLRENYRQKAWRGLLKQSKMLGGTETLAGTDATLLTDYRVLTSEAEGKERVVFGQLGTEGEAADSGVAFGGWWTGAELLDPHWVFTDWGLWPGGQGPRQPGAVTLFCSSGAFPPVKLLEGRDLGRWRGYLTLDLHWDAEAAGWRSGKLRAGWGLAALTYLQPLPSIGGLFATEAAAPKGPRVRMGIRVSIPPYPHSASLHEPVPLLVTPETQRAFVWEDIALVRGQLSTAGLSGCIGLAVGSGATLERAREIATGAIAGLGLAEAQWRTDAAEKVPRVLAALESVGWWG